MKVLVFGATGGTGKHVVEQALRLGHNVTAFVRDPAKIIANNSALKVIQGDVLQRKSMYSAISGHDAVISCLGAPASRAGQLRSVGTQHIIDAMQSSGVSRFICQTSLGYTDSQKILANTSFIFRKIIVPLLLRKTFEEHELQEACIKQSDLEWTIIRAGSLTDGTYTGAYKYNFDYSDKSIKAKISRADTADFILRQLQSNLYYQKVVGVSY